MTRYAKPLTTALVGAVVAFGPAFMAGPALAATGSPTPSKVVAYTAAPAHHLTPAQKRLLAKKAAAKRAAAKKAAAKKAAAKKAALKKAATKKPASTPASPASPSGSSATTALSSYEATLLADVNAARADAGLAPVKLANGPTDVARHWALKLASDGALSHNPALVKDLAAAGCGDWMMLAENVGEAPADDPDMLFQAYMHSTGHRENILNPKAKFIGMGVITVSSPDGDTAWNTMDFSDSYSSSYGAATTSLVSSLLDATGISALAGAWHVTL